MQRRAISSSVCLALALALGGCGSLVEREWVLIQPGFKNCQAERGGAFCAARDRARRGEGVPL